MAKHGGGRACHTGGTGQRGMGGWGSSVTSTTLGAGGIGRGDAFEDAARALSREICRSCGLASLLAERRQ